MKAEEIAVEFTPPAVLALQKCDSTYLRLSKTVQFRSEGAGHDYTPYKLSIQIPVVSGISYNWITVSPKALKELTKLRTRTELLEDRLASDIFSLETALFQLRTKANAIKELPELEKYFPAEMTTALVPNMTGIRELLFVK